MRPALAAAFLLAFGLWVNWSVPACAWDKESAQKRAQLARVRRIVVVPLFYGTPTLGVIPPPERPGKRPAKPSAAPPKTIPNQETYKEYLQKLEREASALLPKRVSARTPFVVVPSEEVAAALKALELTPWKLFQNHGLLEGTRFALPAPPSVRKLAERLRADAVLLGTLDEPRRQDGSYSFSPFGIDSTSPHVRCRGGFFVMQSDGTEILRAYIESLRPHEAGHDPRHLLADWMEATEQVIEDLMNELTRYTPPSPEK
jgi:hypothetical protein